MKTLLFLMNEKDPPKNYHDIHENSSTAACTCNILRLFLESFIVFFYQFSWKLKLNFRCFFPNHFLKIQQYRNSMYKKE